MFLIKACRFGFPFENNGTVQLFTFVVGHFVPGRRHDSDWSRGHGGGLTVVQITGSHY